MKVRCIGNKYENLKDYEYGPLEKYKFGRFDITLEGEYSLTVGREYLVMGMFMFQNYLAYLVDNSGFIFTAPCYLFTLVNPEISSPWNFRVVNNKEKIYPFIQAIWGYKELCMDEQSYEDLIVERKEEAQRIYYRRKNEQLGISTSYQGLLSIG